MIPVRRQASLSLLIFTLFFIAVGCHSAGSGGDHLFDSSGRGGWRSLLLRRHLWPRPLAECSAGQGTALSLIELRGRAKGGTLVTVFRQASISVTLRRSVTFRQLQTVAIPLRGVSNAVHEIVDDLQASSALSERSRVDAFNIEDFAPV
jgi:hypothetical protein